MNFAMLVIQVKDQSKDLSAAMVLMLPEVVFFLRRETGRDERVEKVGIPITEGPSSSKMVARFSFIISIYDLVR